MRRFIFTTLMVWDYPFEGQIVMVIVLTLLTICMHLDRRMINSDVGYVIEIYNEITIVLISYVLIGYAMFVNNGKAINGQGWVHIVLFVKCVSVSAIVLLFTAIKRTFRWFKYRFCRKRRVVKIK